MNAYPAAVAADFKEKKAAAPEKPNSVHWTLKEKERKKISHNVSCCCWLCSWPSSRRRRFD